MLPILECTGSSHVDEIDHIVNFCSTAAIPEETKIITSLTNRRENLGQLEDSSTPAYFESTALAIALLVTSEPHGRDREWRIESMVGNFWDSCDDLLHSSGGYSREEFKGIKTTLRGIEDMWHEGDVQLFHQGGNLGGTYTERLSKIRSNYPKRRQIARIIAECGRWETPTIHP
ncbi:hypothetical protein [Streptomyces sp. NPDC001594]|uniref:hypothetical protein n=1 Tax=Streptomyces sp. NPDC001594 TaxID=3364590 RepID=UPI003695AEBB